LEAVEKSYAERKQLPEGRCQLEAAGKIQHFSWENDGKLTISMAIFNSFILNVYQRVIL
jgi:hypothetical protein